MSLVWVAVAVFVAFGVVVAGILLWARQQVAARRDTGAPQSDRQTYLTLAAQAASDSSGRALVRLLNALDTAPADCPVTVQWVRHMAGNKPPALLVKITWDGNEWRQRMEWAEFRDRLRALIAEEPASGDRVRSLLSYLEATP